MERLQDEQVRVLTVEQVASLCQVSSKTVYRAIRRGALRAARLGAGGAFRVRPEDMEAWIETATPGPTTADERFSAPPAPGLPRPAPLAGRLTVTSSMGRRA